MGVPDRVRHEEERKGVPDRVRHEARRARNEDLLIPDLIRDLKMIVMNELRGFVYILTNRYNKVLYTGVTRDLPRRVAEHRLHINHGFTSKYNVEKLVYYEQFDRLDDAIRRESQLKNWRREWKVKLVADFNPEWQDLAEGVGVDAEYIQAVKEAYECGQYVPGDSGSSPE